MFRHKNLSDYKLHFAYALLKIRFQAVSHTQFVSILPRRKNDSFFSNLSTKLEHFT